MCLLQYIYLYIKNLIIIKGRYTSDGSTEVGTIGADGVTGDGDKTFTSDGSEFEVDGIAENDIIWIKNERWNVRYLLKFLSNCKRL